MTNDPLSNVLASIKNGWMRRLKKIRVPNIKFTQACLELLQKNHCIDQVNVINEREVEIKLKYNSQSCAPFSGFKRISKCSLRKYANVEQIRKITKRYSQYLYVLSTNQGVLTAQEAIVRNIGGELLFQAY